MWRPRACLLVGDIKALRALLVALGCIEAVFDTRRVTPNSLNLSANGAPRHTQAADPRRREPLRRCPARSTRLSRGRTLNARSRRRLARVRRDAIQARLVTGRS